MSKLRSIIMLSVFVYSSLFNQVSANECGPFLAQSKGNDFTVSFLILKDGSLDSPLVIDTSLANLRAKDRLFIESMNEALYSDLNFLEKLSVDDRGLILEGLLRFQANVASPKDIPYYFNLLLAVAQFSSPEGNNLYHVDQALNSLRLIPPVLQYRDYRVMYFLARSLLLTENPKVTDKYDRVIRIINTMVGSRSLEGLRSSIDLSDRLIRTNIGRNIDAGIELQRRAYDKLGLN